MKRGPLGLQLATVIEAMLAEVMNGEMSFTRDDLVSALAHLRDIILLLSRDIPAPAPEPLAPAEPRKFMEISEWCFIVFRNGALWPWKGETWPRLVETHELHASYLYHAAMDGERSPKPIQDFGMEVRAYFPGSFRRLKARADFNRYSKQGELVSEPSWHYRLPALSQCRRHYLKYMRKPATIWGKED